MVEYRLHTHYSSGHSAVHHLDPRTKIILALVYAVIVVSTPPHHLLAYVVYAGLLSWGVAAATIPLSHILSRTAAVLPFSVLAAVWLPFLHGGAKVALLGGWLELSVSGLWLFAGVVMKSFLGACAAILLASVTPFGDLIGSLRKMGVPAVLVDMLALTYRYLFVLLEEAMRLRRAATARGYRPTWLAQAMLIGRLIGQLFLRSYERAERVYGAMVQRGYRGQMPVAHALHFHRRDALVITVLIPLLLVVRVFLQ